MGVRAGPPTGSGMVWEGKGGSGNRKGGYEPCKSYRHILRRRDLFKP